MNFGVVAAKSILQTVVKAKESHEVKRFYAKWKEYINDINLNYYEIGTNSTGSKIQIIAETVTMSYY